MNARMLALALTFAGPAAAAPEDLAPGAPELIGAQQRLEALLATSQATGRATARLQAAWTTLPTPKSACDDTARLALGWRIERFGAAWREASQAARAQAERVRRLSGAATVAPLVDAKWSATLEGLRARAEHDARAFLEASAWEVAWVRPVLAACPMVPLAPAPGIPMLDVKVRGEPAPAVAVLALGDGWVCPDATRADDAVVIVAGAACWSASPTCGCEPQPVEPGAVIGPAPPGEPPADTPADTPAPAPL